MEGILKCLVEEISSLRILRSLRTEGFAEGGGVARGGFLCVHKRADSSNRFSLPSKRATVHKEKRILVTVFQRFATADS